MKKRERASRGDEPKSEYDFRGGTRGRYAARYRAGGNVVVVVDADLVHLFPDSAAVNRVLRAVAAVALRARVRKASRGSRKA